MKKLMILIACLCAMRAEGQTQKPYGGTVKLPAAKDSLIGTDSIPGCPWEQGFTEIIKMFLEDTLGKDFVFPKDSVIKITYGKADPMGAGYGETITKGKKTFSNNMPQRQCISQGHHTYAIKSYAYTPSGVVFWELQIKNYGAIMYFREDAEEFYRRTYKELNIIISKKDFKMHRF